MPITPFHFGPGLFVKSVVPRIFSFRVFILANVIMDLETAYYLVTDQYPLHRFLHTYLGATVVAVGCVLFGRPVCGWATRIWNRIMRSFKIPETPIAQTALVSGAFIGTYSHILLDSTMHGDVRPFSPFSSSNQLFQVLSCGQLHLVCVVAGILGVASHLLKVKSQKV